MKSEQIQALLDRFGGGQMEVSAVRDTLVFLLQAELEEALASEAALAAEGSQGGAQ